MGGVFRSISRIFGGRPSIPAGPTPEELEAEAEAEAQLQADQPNRNRVRTILTERGQTGNSAAGAAQRKTVLGG